VQPPVVEDRQLGLGHLVHQAGIAPVAVGRAQLLKHPGQAVVAHQVAPSAGLVTQGAGQPGLAGTGPPRDAQVLVLLDPVALSEDREVGAVDAAGVSVVDVHNAGAGAQLGRLEQADEAAVVAVQALVLEQQAEALAHEGVGDAVVVAVRLVVVVDARIGLLPLGVAARLGGQGLESRAIQDLRGALTRAGRAFEGPLVELDGLLTDGDPEPEVGSTREKVATAVESAAMKSAEFVHSAIQLITPIDSSDATPYPCRKNAGRYTPIRD